MSFFNRLGEIAKDAGNFISAQPRIVWDIATGTYQNDKDFQGFKKTLTQATTNYGQRALPFMGDVAEGVGKVAEVPGIKQVLQGIDTVNREVVREPLTAIALMDTDFKKSGVWDGLDQNSIGSLPEAYGRAHDLAQDVTFGQAMRGSLQSDNGSAEARNFFNNTLDWNDQAAVDKRFSQGADMYWSGGFDATIQILGDVTIVGGKVGKVARGASWASNKLDDASKIRKAIDGVQAAEDGTEVNKFVPFLDTLVSSDAQFISQLPEMKGAPAPLVHALGKVTDSVDEAGNVIAGSGRKQAGIIYRAGLGDPNALADLRMSRPDMANPIARSQGELDAYQQWAIAKNTQVDGMLELPWENQGLMDEIDSEMAALKANDKKFANYFALEEMAQTPGGSLTRSVGATPFQAMNRQVAGGRVAKFYDLKPGQAKVSVYQPTPFHRMYQTVSWAAGERPAGIVNLNDPESSREITAVIKRGMKRSALSDVTARQMMDSYLGAATPEARAEQVYKIERVMFGNLAKRNGLSVDQAEEIYSNYKRARGSAYDALKTKGYAVDIDGTVFKAPFFESQTANYLPMMDFDMAASVLRQHRLIAKNDLLSKSMGYGLSAGKNLVDGVDTIQSMFKIGALMRLGYMVRNGAEAQLRIAASLGAMTSMRHLGPGMKNLTYNTAINGGSRVIDRVKSVGPAMSYEDRLAELGKTRGALQATQAELAAAEREMLEAAGQQVDVLHHGTVAPEFDKFDSSAAGYRGLKNKNGSQNGGFYFSDSKDVAAYYGENRANGALSSSALERLWPDAPTYDDYISDPESYDADFASLLREKFGKKKMFKLDENGSEMPISAADVKLSDVFDDLISVEQFPNARTITKPIYGQTLDLRPTSDSMSVKQVSSWFNGLPDDFRNLLKEKTGITDGNRFIDWQGQYQHEKAKWLVDYARTSGFGKIRVLDSGLESGGHSVIAIPEAIDNPDFASSITDIDAQGKIEVLKNVLAEKQAFFDHQNKRLTELEKGGDRTKRRMASGTYEYTGIDGTKYTLDEAFGGPFGDIHWNNSSGENSMINLVDNQAGLLSRKMTTSGFGTVTPDMPNYWTEWSTSLNRYFGNSLVARKLAAGESVEDVTKWLRSSPEGRNLRGRLGLDMTDAAEHVSVAKGLVDSHLPDDELKMMLANKQDITPELLRSKSATIQGDLPDVAGHVLEENLNLTGTRKVQSIVSGVFKLIGSMPEDAWARHPVYDHLYRKALQDRIDKFTALNGRPVSTLSDDVVGTSEMGLAMRAAHADALRGTKDLLFTMDRKTNLASFMRFVSPFFSAFENSVKTWGKIAASNPQVVNRANLLVTAPNRAGIATDQNGQPVSVEDATMDDFMWIEVPQGLKKLPGVGKGLASLDQMGIQKKSLDVVFQGSAEIPVGPYVAIPISELVKKKPELEDSMKWALPYGPERNAATAMLPSWLKKQITKNEGQDSAQYANSYTLIWQTEQHKRRDAGLPPATADEIKAMTDAYWNMRSVANLVLPFAPQFNSPYKLYIDQWRQYKETWGVQAEEKYWEDFGDDFFDFTTSLSKNNTGAGATQTDVANAKAHSDLVAKIGDIDPKMIGLVTAAGRGEYEFSQAAYQWQQNTPISANNNTKFRGTNDPAQAMKETNSSLGWIKYRSVMNQIDAVMQQRGFTNLQVNGAGDLAALKKQMVTELAKSNPDWYTDYKDVDGSKYIKTRQVFSAIMSNEKFMQAYGEDPTWKSVGVYLQVRGEADKVLANRESKSLDAKSNADVKMLLETTATQLKQQDIGFGDIYDRYFAYDPGFDPVVGVTQ